MKNVENASLPTLGIPKLIKRSPDLKIYFISRAAKTPSAPPSEKPVTQILAVLYRAVKACTFFLTYPYTP